MNRCATSFHLGVVQSVLKSKRVAASRKFTKLQPVHNRDAGQFVVTLSSPLQNRLQTLVVLRVDRQGDMHVRGPKWIFPVSWSIAAYVVQKRRSRRHALAEFRRETLQRCLRHPQCLETFIRKSDPQPTRQSRYPPISCRRYVWKNATQHFASL